MSNWKEINVLNEMQGYSSFYTEGYGLISRIRVDCAPVDRNGKPVGYVYADYNPHTREKSEDLYPMHTYSLDSIFSFNFYKYEPKTQRNYYYGQPNQIKIDDARKLTVKYKIDIKYDIISIDANGRAASINKQESLIISNMHELPDIKVWATKDNVGSYALPVLMDLQEGQKYFYVGSGICEVIKVYDYPNKQSNNICRIVFANGAEQDVLIGDKRFVYIPTEYRDELLQFNITLNELALQPIMQCDKEHNLINVMWQPIETAARYVVKLYRYVNDENRRKVYFLKDYEVDRNEHFLSINDLIINGHFVVVVAENRSGEVVARSRGIDIATSKGEPKWF